MIGETKNKTSQACRDKLLGSLGGWLVVVLLVILLLRTVFTASLDEDLLYCKEKILGEDYLCGERRRLRGCRTIYIGNNIWLLKTVNLPLLTEELL